MAAMKEKENYMGATNYEAGEDDGSKEVTRQIDQSESVGEKKTAGDTQSKPIIEQRNPVTPNHQPLNQHGSIELEKLDVRVPLDVWVSCGEPFIPLDGKRCDHSL